MVPTWAVILNDCEPVWLNRPSSQIKGTWGLVEDFQWSGRCEVGVCVCVFVCACVRVCECVNCKTRDGKTWLPSPDFIRALGKLGCHIIFHCLNINIKHYRKWLSSLSSLCRHTHAASMKRAPWELGGAAVDWRALWVWPCALCGYMNETRVCAFPAGVAVTVSVATVDKAAYGGGAGNDAGDHWDKCRGGVSAASCWSHHITFYTQHRKKKKKKSECTGKITFHFSDAFPFFPVPVILLPSVLRHLLLNFFHLHCRETWITNKRMFFVICWYQAFKKLPRWLVDTSLNYLKIKAAMTIISNLWISKDK